MSRAKTNVSVASEKEKADDRADEKTEITQAVCLKVQHLRPRYSDLEQWMQDPRDVYTGRAGRIWITDSGTCAKEKRIFHYAQSPWANPLKLDSKSGQIVLAFRTPYVKQAAIDALNAQGPSVQGVLALYLQYLLDSGLADKIEELRGKKLGCYCAPGEPCHAQLLADILNEGLPAAKRKHGLTA